MSKDDLNVGDGKRMEEPKERDKEKEEEASLKMKRKPPKELMKGGIRDRSLFSWIRILGWFFIFQLLIDSSLLFVLSGCCHLVGVHHWLPGWLLRPHVRVNLHDYVLPVQNEMPTIRYTILYGSEEDSKAPYFVRNQNKYPNLLPQPGIKIDCVSISINLFFQFHEKTNQ